MVFALKLWKKKKNLWIKIFFFPLLYNHIFVNDGTLLSITTVGIVYEDNELVGVVNKNYFFDKYDEHLKNRLTVYNF